MRLRKIVEHIMDIEKIVKQRIDNQEDRYDRLEQRVHELEQFTWASVSREGINAEAQPLETPEALIEGELPAHDDELKIAHAIANERAIMFNYVKDGEILREWREVSPYELKKVQNGVVVLGWDHDREAIRSFRLDRIGGAVHVCDLYVADDGVTAGFRLRYRKPE